MARAEEMGVQKIGGSTLSALAREPLKFTAFDGRSAVRKLLGAQSTVKRNVTNASPGVLDRTSALDLTSAEVIYDQAQTRRFSRAL